MPDAADGTRAEVRVVESASGRLLFDRSVRYRQLPETDGVPSARHARE